MSTKQKKYSSDFKTKVVLEVMEGDSTLNQICSKYGLVPKSVRQWKKVFIQNASLAFSIDKATAESNAKLVAKQKEVDELHR